MNITHDTTVASIATEHPLATRVFARHRIDFCCAGQRPVSEICLEKGIDADQLVAEIQAELARAPETAERWDSATTPDLIAHILEAYHVPLKEELPRLESMARKVHRVHFDKHPEQFEAMLTTFLAIKNEIDVHLVEEEDVLFPGMLSGSFDVASSPMAKIESEHVVLGRLLEELRAASMDYVVPEEACNTWRGLWVGLEDLERQIHEHVHLENNILHPRFA